MLNSPVVRLNQTIAVVLTFIGANLRTLSVPVVITTMFTVLMAFMPIMRPLVTVLASIVSMPYVAATM